MNLDKLQQLVHQLGFAQHLGASDSELIQQLVEYLYNETGGDLIQFFVLIDKLNKDKMKKENMILYRGLEDAMHHFSFFSEQSKKGNKIKPFVNFYFNNPEGNVAFIINIMKAYFPDGEVGGAANSGKYFFDKFKELLLKNKDKYLNGENTEWAKSQNHYDYIKMFIEKNNNV